MQSPIKICIWMNIPSHYQSAFFAALRLRKDVDLVVRYFNGTSDDRKKEGWKDTHELEPFEQCVKGLDSVEEMLGTISDWNVRIHVISSYFNSELIDYFCDHGVPWCHWSEMPGIRLAELLNYRMGLYRVLNPLMLILKHREGRRINLHALHAFGQGVLAERAFRLMGVSKNKISDLYYTPDPLLELDPSERVARFSDGRKVFLSVGALCKRKGTDVLIKAFAGLAANDWCLVLCGLDKTGGAYHALVEKLGLQDHVLFLGAYPVNNIAEVYRASDVVILASRFDGWGAVLNEAASLGIPLIGSDMCSASWHVIKDGMNGFRVKADSVRALKKAMQSYIENTQLIHIHGQRSKDVYFSEFTPDINAERFKSALDKLEVQSV